MKTILLFVSLVFCGASFAQTSEESVRKEKSETVIKSKSSETEKDVTTKNGSKITSHPNIVKGNFNKKSAKSKTSDFPQYIDTGDLEKDVADYEARKKQWIQDNPEKYQAMMQKSNSSSQSKTREPQVVTRSK